MTQASLIAMRRTARMARELVMRINTAIIVLRSQTLVRVSVEELPKTGIR